MDFHEYGEDMGFDNDDDGRARSRSSRSPSAHMREMLEELSASMARDLAQAISDDLNETAAQARETAAAAVARADEPASKRKDWHWREVTAWEQEEQARADGRDIMRLAEGELPAYLDPRPPEPY